MLWPVRFLLLCHAAALLIAVLGHAPWTESDQITLSMNTLIVCPPPERYCQQFDPNDLFRDTQVPCQAKYAAISVQIAIAVEICGLIIGTKWLRLIKGIIAAEIVLLLGAILLWTNSGCTSLGSPGWGLWLALACAVSSILALLYMMVRYKDIKDMELDKPLMMAPM